MQQKKIFFVSLIVLLFFGCQTVQFHPPIEFTQDEVKSLHVVDVHGRQSQAGPGRIQDCYTTKQVGIDECAVIICKEAKDQPTSLRCNYYVPKIVPDPAKAKSTALHSYREQNTSELMDQWFKTAQQSSEMKSIELKCMDPLISCYLNSRYYPNSKPASSAKLSTLLHKKTYALKNGDQLEVSVFKD